MPNLPYSYIPRFRRTRMPAILVAAFLIGCSAPVPRPIGPARDYDDAKDMFKRGRFDRALDFTDGLAKAVPPTSHTERAQVLRVIIYSGMMQGYKTLVDAYAKGYVATMDARVQAEFKRISGDYLYTGAQASLGLAEAARQLTEGSKIAKQLTLEAPYPSTEGPLEVTQLNRVKDGGWIEANEQEAAALDAQRKGIDDALAAAVGGDRSKARSALTAGPVKLDGVDFCLFIGKQLLDAFVFFDRKHLMDSQKLGLLSNQADEAANAALALLKQNPNKDKEKAVKKLQDQIKATLKAI